MIAIFYYCNYQTHIRQSNTITFYNVPMVRLFLKYFGRIIDCSSCRNDFDDYYFFGLLGILVTRGRTASLKDLEGKE